jgi:hypothetical protein
MGTIRCVPRGWLVTTVVCCLVRLARSDNNCELGLDGSCAAAELISSAQCGLYMAESAIPGSGLGMFAAIPIRANQRIFYGDVVVLTGAGMAARFLLLESHQYVGVA